MIGHQQERPGERVLRAFGAERRVDAEHEVTGALRRDPRVAAIACAVGPIVSAGTDGSSIMPMKLLSAVR